MGEVPGTGVAMVLNGKFFESISVFKKESYRLHHKEIAAICTNVLHKNNRSMIGFNSARVTHNGFIAHVGGETSTKQKTE